MNSHRRIWVVLVLVLTLVPSLPAADDIPLPPEAPPWLDAQSAHFRITSELPERETKQLALGFEALRAVMRNVRLDVSIERMNVEADDPFDIFIFRNDSSFGPFSSGAQFSGFFHHSRSGFKIAFSAQTEEPTKIVYHEMIHYLLSKNYPDVPVWLGEGLAEYYSTMSIEGNEARLGIRAHRQVSYLTGRHPFPSQELLKIGHDSAVFKDPSETERFYASSWLLVHFFLGGAPERKAQFGQFLALLEAGTPAEAAFQKAIPLSFAQLDREVAKYLWGLQAKYKFWKVTFEELKVPKQFSSRPLPYATTLGRLALLAQDIPDRGDLARQLIEASLSRDPRCPPALLAQGLARIRNGDKAEGGQLIATALEGVSDPWILNNAALNLLGAEGSRSTFGTPLTPLLAQARALLRRTIELNPGELQPLLRFADLSFSARADIQEARTILEKSSAPFAHQPSFLERKFSLTLADGDWPAAQQIIETALADPFPATHAWADATQKRHATLFAPSRFIIQTSSGESRELTTISPPGRSTEEINASLAEVQDCYLESTLSGWPATPAGEAARASIREANRLFRKKAIPDGLATLAALEARAPDSQVSAAISTVRLLWQREIHSWTIDTFNAAVTQANSQGLNGAVKLMEQVARLAIDPKIKEKAQALIEKWKKPRAQK